MKLLYVTAECWPFIKTGGLGDVSYALPKELKKEGVDVRVIMPKYSTIPSYLKDQFKPVAEFINLTYAQSLSLRIFIK